MNKDANLIKFPATAVRTVWGDNWNPVSGVGFDTTCLPAIYDKHEAWWKYHYPTKSKPDFRGEMEKLLNTMPQLISHKANLGIEVEAELSQPYWSDVFPNFLWKWHHDNSLKDDGVEWISHPLKSESARDALCLLWACIKAYNPKIKFGWRSSIHVHLDMTKQKMPHVMKFLLAYLILEESIFEFSDPARKGSIFCVPLTRTSLYQDVSDYLHGNSTPSRLISSWEKYSALNFLPLCSQGTIEFRHLNGTIDLAKILNWINLILKLDKYATDTGMEDLIKDIQALNTNSQYDHFKNKVFGQEFGNTINDNQLAKHMSDGVKFAKACLQPIKKIGDLTPEKSALCNYYDSMISEDEKRRIKKQIEEANKPQPKFNIKSAVLGMYGLEPPPDIKIAYKHIYDELTLDDYEKWGKPKKVEVLKWEAPEYDENEDDGENP